MYLNNMITRREIIDTNSLKRKSVFFSSLIDINSENMIPINKHEYDLKWYKADEIQAFRKDANMISRAFLTQIIGRKRRKVSSTLSRSKTVCVLGLENRINYKRRLQKASVVKLVLNAQKKFQKTYNFPTLERYLAMLSSAATLNASRLALEDGRNLSEEVCSQNFPLIKQPDVSDQIYVLPYLTTNNGSNRSSKCANNFKTDQSNSLDMCVYKGKQLFSESA